MHSKLICSVNVDSLFINQSQTECLTNIFGLFVWYNQQAPAEDCRPLAEMVLLPNYCKFVFSWLQVKPQKEVIVTETDRKQEKVETGMLGDWERETEEMCGEMNWERLKQREVINKSQRLMELSVVENTSQNDQTHKRERESERDRKRKKDWNRPHLQQPLLHFKIPSFFFFFLFSFFFNHNAF